jgi:hypothetical protein
MKKSGRKTDRCPIRPCARNDSRPEFFPARLATPHRNKASGRDTILLLLFLGAGARGGDAFEFGGTSCASSERTSFALPPVLLALALCSQPFRLDAAFLTETCKVLAAPLLLLGLGRQGHS